MNKRIFLILTVELIAASAIVGPAYADGQTPSFDACKDVTFVATKAEAQKLEAASPDCLAADNPLIGSNMFSVPKAAAALDVTYLWKEMMQDQYVPDLKKNISYWNQVQACLGKSDCTQHDGIKQAYGSYIRKLRIDLALANIASNNGKPKLEKFDDSAFSKMVGGLFGGISDADRSKLMNIFPPAVLGNLTPDEMKEVQARLGQGNLGDIQKAARKAYVKDLTAGVNKGDYLVAFLPSPSDTKGNSSQASWTPEQWDTTIGKLVKNANQELASATEIANKDPKDFPQPPFQPDEFNRLRYEMNKYLSKDGNYTQCGDAEAAVTWMNNTQKKQTAAQFAAFGVMGAGAETADLLRAEEGFVARVGTVAAGVTSGVGGTLGVMMTADNFHEAKVNAAKTFASVAKIGVEQGAEADTQSQQAAEAAIDANNHALRSAIVGTAEMGAGGIVVGVVGAKAAGALAKWAAQTLGKAMTVSPEGKEALAKLLLASDKPDVVIQALKDAKGTRAQVEALKANLTDMEQYAAAEKILHPNIALYKNQMSPQDLDEVDGLIKKLQDKRTLEVEERDGCGSLSAADCELKSARTAAEETNSDLEKANKECGIKGAPGAGAVE